MERLRALRVDEGDNPEDGTIASYLARTMMEEAGVELVL